MPVLYLGLLLLNVRYARRTIDNCIVELYSSSLRTDELGLVMKTKNTHGIVVSALKARTHFGSLLRQVEENRGSLVIEKRGTPRAVLLSIRDYVRLAAPEPEILKALGEESRQNRTDTLTSREIDQLIRKTRARKMKR
jgi:prevent-host-death family protein